MKILQGKKAIITRAGKGLGKAIALAAEGVNLGLIGRTTADLEKLHQELTTLNPAIAMTYATADIGDFNQVKTAVSEISNSLKTIDILVNNPGILKMGSFLELPVEEWEQVFRINVLGTYYVIHEVLPLLLMQGQGDIINIASTAGLK